jgi:flagellin-like protein
MGNEGPGDRGVSPQVGAVLMIGIVVVLVLAFIALPMGIGERLSQPAVFHDDTSCPGFQEEEFTKSGENFDEFLEELQSNNCALWLQGGNYETVDGNASQWLDQGPNSFHATQSDPDSRPEVVSDSDLGIEVLEFDANHSVLEDYADQGDQPESGITDGDYLDISRDVEELGVDEGSGFAINAVLKVSSFDRGGTWTVGEPGQDGREFSMRTCSDYAFDGCQHSDPAGEWRGQHWGETDIDFSSGSASTDEWLILTHAYDSETEEAFIRVNGEEVARDSIELNLSANRNIQLGRWIRLDDDPHYYFDGRMAEVTVFDRTLTAAEIDTVEEYMSTTYGISLDGPLD